MSPTAAAPIGQRHIAAIQRARMLTGLAQVACDEGLANVTVAKVVDRAGVSRRTFYETFSDVGECLLAVLERSLDEARERVLPGWEGASSGWRGQVRAGLAELLLFFDEQPDVANLLVVQWISAGPPAAEMRRRVLRRLADVVSQGGRPDDDPEQAAIAAEAVVGGVFAILHRRLTEPAEGAATATRAQTFTRGASAAKGSRAGGAQAGAGKGSRAGSDIQAGAGIQAGTGNAGAGIQAGSGARLAELTSPLMSMIVLPYLGRAAARAELAKPAPEARRESVGRVDNPLKNVDLRLTQRTAAVIAAAATRPGSSNRALGQAAGIHDQGQISKLLMRLARIGVLVNDNAGNHRVSGAPNAWRLTAIGEQVAGSLGLGG